LLRNTEPSFYLVRLELWPNPQLACKTDIRWRLLPNTIYEYTA
jgi:hypothetical protein